MLHCGEAKKEKTLATGRNILIAVCICKLFCGKGWKFIESLEYQPDWKLVSVFDHHIPECGLSSSVCVCVCVCLCVCVCVFQRAEALSLSESFRKMNTHL